MVDDVGGDMMWLVVWWYGGWMDDVVGMCG